MKRKSKGQVIAEYAALIALVVASIVAMSFFVKRLLQARMADARDTMMSTVRSSYEGEIPDQYEPYYTQQNSQVSREINDQMNLLRGGRTGIYIKTFNETTTVNSQSVQLPPGMGSN